MNEPTFKYKVIFKHDGTEETFYVINNDDLKTILSSLNSACSYGTYKDCDIKREKLR